MNNDVTLPFVSQFDPPQQSEGSGDPLGLYAIANSLGVRLAPGIRERQSTPRFLTLALVGMTVCEDDWSADTNAISSWLMYEWLIIESFVRQLRDKSELQGIPGWEKVLSTIRSNDVVCERTYLKAPSDNGFHGIYRVLGVKAGIFDELGKPLELSRRILSAWESEQGLMGFVDGRGPGRDFRRSLSKAIRKGQEIGHGIDLGSKIRNLIVENLHPRKAGRKESEAIWDALMCNDTMRREYAHSLISVSGQNAWYNASDSEAAYHEWLIKQTTANDLMRQLLISIRGYERLARLLLDAFSEILWISTNDPQPVSFKKLGLGFSIVHAKEEFLKAYYDAVSCLREIDPSLSARVERLFGCLGDVNSSADFAQALVEHHIRIQASKSPNGKRPWFDLIENRGVAVRPAYAMSRFDPDPSSYVYRYRCRPLTSFARQLGRIGHDEGAL